MKRIFIWLTGGAFLALILLIAALALNGIYQIERLQQQIGTVVELHNRKIDAVTAIQVDALARADRLLRMAIESDPFSRERLHTEFKRAGLLVGSGRTHLRKLGLTPEEQALFDEQSESLGKIEPMQERIADHLVRGEVENAWGILVAEGIPMQERLDAQLAELREKLQQANNLALWEARQNYQRTLFFTLLSGITATVLGMGLAWFTLRRLASDAREIEWQMKALEASHAALEIEATHDAMTGLANRKLFYDRLKQAMLQAKRYGGKVGVLFVDLDKFKLVNDLHGHHVGDALLSEVALRLAASVRESDTVARAGGDEFLIMLRGIGGREDCQSVMQKIEAALGEKAVLCGIELAISASIGLSIYPDDGDTEDELIRTADASMYRLKNGRSKGG